MSVEVKIDLKEIRMVPLSEIKLNPKNRNKHPQEQIDRFVKILRANGFRSLPVISNRTGQLVVGEGRYLAMKQEGMTEMLCSFQDFENEAEEYAHAIADNALQEWSSLDRAGINQDILDLGPFDIDNLGLKDFVVDVSEFNEPEPEVDSEEKEEIDQEKEIEENEDIPEKIEPQTKLHDHFRIGQHQLYNGDCLERMKLLENESIHALVSDPPAGIAFMGKDWDEDKGGGKEWIAWMTRVMEQAFRVLKPGAHGLVWAIPRTAHWTMQALEDAGFDIRDVIVHVFGSGFPKSLDISKAIDKAAGAEREVVGYRKESGPDFSDPQFLEQGSMMQASDAKRTQIPITKASTPDAKKWAGFGTALKPASEHWILVRKPISEKTVAANVIQHGTGGINIDATRIGANESQGRFPTNFILSHNPDCVEVGTKKVKTSNPNSADGKIHSKENQIYGKRADLASQNTNYASEDGTETVAAFNCHPKLSSALYDVVLNDPQVTSILDSQGGYRFYRDFYDELLRLVSVYGLNVFPSGSDVLGLCGLYLSLLPHIQQHHEFCLLSNLDDFFQHCIQDDILSHNTVAQVCQDQTLSDKLCTSYKAKFLKISNSKPESKTKLDDNHETPNRIACTPDQLKTLCFLKTCLASDLITHICPVAELDRQSGECRSSGTASKTNKKYSAGDTSIFHGQASTSYSDSGGASRFFYVAKPSKREKNEGCEELEVKNTRVIGRKHLRCLDCGCERIASGGLVCGHSNSEWINNSDDKGDNNLGGGNSNHHPTVKSLKLMSYLITMVTPPGGTLIDPFGGSGTTLVAAELNGFKSILFEQSEEYCDIILARAEKVTKTKAEHLNG